MFLNNMQEVLSIWKEISVFLPEVLVVILVFIIEAKHIDVFYKGSVMEKIERAKELGQVVEGVLDDKKKAFSRDKNFVHAWYKYSINGRVGRIRVEFNARGVWFSFPEKIKVYYFDNKVYTDYSGDPFRGILFSIIPFVVGAIVMYLRHPELFRQKYMRQRMKMKKIRKQMKDVLS